MGLLPPSNSVRLWHGTFATFSALLLALAGCGPTPRRVVVYASQDQVYAEPILKRFTEETGIRVDAIYDSEAVKTVGLANRLIAEQARPVADLFWGNEELRTRQLAARGVLKGGDHLLEIGSRSRCLIYNRNLLSHHELPPSMIELTNSRWSGKIALAYPLFGSTSTHFLLLRQHWGESNWLTWCRALVANKPILFEGNSMVAGAVGRGQCLVGLTDSDDFESEFRSGKPVARAAWTPELSRLANTVGRTPQGPHPQEAAELMRYLASDSVKQALTQAHALEPYPSSEQPLSEQQWEATIRDVVEATGQLKDLFLRP